MNGRYPGQLTTVTIIYCNKDIAVSMSLSNIKGLKGSECPVSVATSPAGSQLWHRMPGQISIHTFHTQARADIV